MRTEYWFMNYLFYVTGLVFWLGIGFLFLALFHVYLFRFSNKTVRFVYTHIIDTIMLPYYLFKVSRYDNELSIRTLKFLNKSKRFQSKILFKYISKRLQRKGVDFNIS